MINPHYHGEGMWTALSASAGITFSSIIQSDGARAIIANFITTILVGVVVGVLKTKLKQPRRPQPRKKKDHAT